MKKLLFAGIFLMTCTPILMSATEQPMIGSDRDEHGCIGSAGYTWSGSSQRCIRPWEQTGSTLQGTGARILPPPRALSGAVDEMKGIGIAIAQLSPTDRSELIKTIRTYLTSKGITIPTGEQAKEVRQANQQDRQETRQSIKDAQKKFKEVVKEKRTERQKRIQERRDSVTR